MPLIVGLLLASSPTAVAGFIVAVVVDTVKSERGIGASSHVFEESSKVFPAVANRDAASAIMLVAGVRDTVTPGIHILPRSILFSALQLSVLGVASNKTFLSEASATLGLTRSELVPGGVYNVPACAFAFPENGLAATFATVADYKQAFKSCVFHKHMITQNGADTCARAQHWKRFV